MRVYEARVPEGLAPVKMALYLRRAFPLLPDHVLRDALSARDVKQDGTRVNADTLTVPGAAVRLYTAFAVSLPAVYEDEHVLLINKPAGLSSDEDEWGGMTVLSEANRERPDKRLRLCHRLDNQTSGLIILAADDESEQCLLSAFEERKLDKHYQCLVRGVMRPPEGEAQAFLVRDSRLGRVRVVSHPTPEGRTIRTAWETLGHENGCTRLSVDLLTGRTHQIRAHMAYLAHPVLGDDVYGDRAFNRKLHAEGKLKLCSWKLTLQAGGALSYLDGRTFSVPVPF